MSSRSGSYLVLVMQGRRRDGSTYRVPLYINRAGYVRYMKVYLVLIRFTAVLTIFCLLMTLGVALISLSEGPDATCPENVDLDLQLACAPVSLAYQEFPMSYTSVHQPKDGQCVPQPVQTLPRQASCHKASNGKKNDSSCFTQVVFYQKWNEIEIVKIPLLWSTKFYSLSEMQRLYSYSCKGRIDEIRISYKEPLQLIDRIRVSTPISLTSVKELETINAY